MQLERITKKCKGSCGETKSIEDFYKENTGKHGVKAYCKVCYNDKYVHVNKQRIADLEEKVKEMMIRTDPGKLTLGNGYQMRGGQITLTKHREEESDIDTEDRQSVISEPQSESNEMEEENKRLKSELKEMKEDLKHNTDMAIKAIDERDELLRKYNKLAKKYNKSIGHEEEEGDDSPRPKTKTKKEKTARRISRSLKS